MDILCCDMEKNNPFLDTDEEINNLGLIDDVTPAATAVQEISVNICNWIALT